MYLFFSVEDADWGAQVAGDQVQLATEVQSLAVLPAAVAQSATPLT